MNVTPGVSVNGTNRSPTEADVLTPVQSSQSPSGLISQELKNVLNAFFLTLSADNLSPYQDTTDPRQLTQNRIENNCRRFYFQVLQQHYASFYFLSEQQLQEARQEAFRHAIEHCELLIDASTNIQTAVERKRVSDEIHKTLQLIGSLLSNKNAEKRLQYISSQKTSIQERFKQTLKSRYNFGMPQKSSSKFYNHEKMEEFVNNAVKRYHDNCESLIQLLMPLPQQRSNNCRESVEGQMKESFESLKRGISKYGSDLIGKNWNNKKSAEGMLDDIVYISFETQCKEIFKDKSFLNKGVMLEAIKEQKRNCLQQIITVCAEHVVEDVAELQAKCEKNLEQREKHVTRNVIKCVKDVGKNHLNCYGDKIGLKLPDLLEVVRNEASGSNVMDCHAEAFITRFLDAFEKAKEDCYQMLIFDDNADKLCSNEGTSNQNGESDSNDVEIVEDIDVVGGVTPPPTPQLSRAQAGQGQQGRGQRSSPVGASSQARDEYEYDSDTTTLMPPPKYKRGWSNGPSPSSSHSPKTGDRKRGRKQ